MMGLNQLVEIDKVFFFIVVIVGIFLLDFH
jgi:hypothetical protein